MARGALTAMQWMLYGQAMLSALFGASVVLVSAFNAPSGTSPLVRLGAAGIGIAIVAVAGVLYVLSFAVRAALPRDTIGVLLVEAAALLALVLLAFPLNDHVAVLGSGLCAAIIVADLLWMREARRQARAREARDRRWAESPRR